MSSPRDMVALEAGRSLCFSPRWECSEFGLVFDRPSGDYWIVSELSFHLLEILEVQRIASFAELTDELRPKSPFFDLENALKLTLQSLVENGIVQPLHWSTSTDATLHEQAD